MANGRSRGFGFGRKHPLALPDNIMLASINPILGTPVDPAPVHPQSNLGYARSLGVEPPYKTWVRP